MEFAEDLIAESLELYDTERNRPFFNRAEFRRETDVLKDNALFLATDRELHQIIEFLQDEIDQAREQANPFYFDLMVEEDEEEGGSDIEQLREVYHEIIPSELSVSEECNIMV